MWYLQGDTFILLAAFSLLAGALRRFCPQKVFSIVLPVLELAALFYISKRLCVLYIAFVLMGIVCSQLLLKFRKKGLFLLFSLAATVPFFLSRAESFSITLPVMLVTIGMAFAMLKLIDVYYFVYYTGIKADPVVLVNYLLFLPVFTAGPIFRYRDFITAHSKPLPLTAQLYTDSFKRIVRGMFKKIVLVSCCSMVMERLMGMSEHWYVSLCAIIVSWLILYFDLSGYSDIAIAFGGLAGYRVPENFKRPWAAASFTQFWRSWHATLSDWIREHIYVLVAKKKLSRGVSSLISFVTMVVMALWHGFNLPYLLAGVYNGLLLAAEGQLGLTTVNKRKTKKSVYYLRCFAVNFLFAVNSLVFTLSTEQVLFVLRGVVRL